MSDEIKIALVVCGAALAIMAIISWILHYFVALRSPPSKRAGWIAGISYLAATTAFVFGSPEGYGWAAPLAAMPAALIIFWFWRSDFRRDWLDDTTADGTVELANDDWRVGLLQLGLVLLVGIAVAVFRRFVRGS